MLNNNLDRLKYEQPTHTTQLRYKRQTLNFAKRILLLKRGYFMYKVHKVA